MAAALIAITVLALAAGLRQAAAGPRQPGKRGRRARRPRHQVPAASGLERAGLAGQLSPRALLLARLLAAGCGILLGSVFGAALPERVQLPFLAAAGCAGFALPDLLIERAARRRLDQVVARLPDAIEVLAVTAGGGRSVAASITELARAGSGPLGRELAVAAAEIECGTTPAVALRGLRQRVPAPELGTLLRAIERSARLGSPLAESLQRQSGALRESARQRLAEQAARAAPKIQLVIALILVPSVLLLIAAGLVANADLLLNGIPLAAGG